VWLWFTHCSFTRLPQWPHTIWLEIFMNFMSGVCVLIKYNFMTDCSLCMCSTFSCVIPGINRLDLFIPGVDVVGGYSICSPPHQLVTQRTLQLAIKSSPHPPTLWMCTQVCWGTVNYSWFRWGNTNLYTEFWFLWVQFPSIAKLCSYLQTHVHLFQLFVGQYFICCIVLRILFVAISNSTLHTIAHQCCNHMAP